MNIKITKKVNLFSGILIISLFGCNLKNDKGIIQQSVVPIRFIDRINDSIHLSDKIMELRSDEGIIFLVDHKVGKAYILNPGFELISTIQKGRGPSEFIGIYNSIIKDDKIFIFDYRNVKIFSKSGEFINSFNPPYRDNLIFQSAIDSDYNIYSSSYLTEHPIIKYDTNGQIINEFGKFLPFVNEKEKRAINYRYFILSDNNALLTIYVSKPMIEQYTLEGECIGKLDLSGFFEFSLKRTEKKIKENPNKRYVTHRIIEDIDYQDGKLYLLYWGDYDTPKCNQVLVIKDEKNKLTIERNINLDLKGGAFKFISVEGEKLYAYDAAGAEVIMFNIGSNN